MTKLILIRHGQTSSNVEGRWQGWTDTPLNELGRKQAELAAERLGEIQGQVHALYSSPLMRAYQTALPIAAALGVPIRLIEGLKEFNFGMVEGLTTEEIEDRFPDMLEEWRDRSNLAFAYPGGESRTGFLQRIGDTMDALTGRHQQDETLVLVAHGGVLRATLAHYLPEQAERWRKFPAGNCSLTTLNVNGRGTEVLTLDDQEHLRVLQPELAT